MIRATQIKGAPLWGLLGCGLALVGSACTDEKPSRPTTMPSTDGIAATVTLADHDVGLVTGLDHGDPCYQLRVSAPPKGEVTDMSSYSCIQATDALSSEFLIKDGRQLAVGGAVAASITTVTVNGQPAHRNGRYFLAVLPTVPDGDVEVVASDQDGRVVVSQRQPRTLITSQQTSPPPRP